MFLFAIIYLSLPVFLVLFTFFSVPFTVLSGVALFILVFCLCNTWQQESDENFCLRKITRCWPLLLVALVLTYLCVSRPFDVWDWEKHYAVFNALIQNPWPPVIELSQQTYFLRYFVAWYVLPSLSGKIFGLQLLTFAMFIWTAVGVCITLFLSFSHLRGKSHLFIAALVFFFFSGLDVLVLLLRQSYIETLSTNWLQFWSGWGHIGSNIFGMAWIPQHIIGASVGTCVFLYNRQLAVRYSIMIVVVVSMWSVFPAIGLIPIAVRAIIKEGYRTAFTPQNLLAAPLVAVPISLYFLQGAGDVPFMYVWEHKGFSISNFVLFCVFEFLIILTILYFLLKKERDLIITMACFLIVLCLVRFGTDGDLLMRATIPTVCIISILTFRALMASRNLWRELLIMYLFIGAFPPAIAFVYGVSPSSGRVDRSIDFKKLTALYSYEEHPNMTFNYLVKVKDTAIFSGTPLLREFSDKRGK